MKGPEDGAGWTENFNVAEPVPLAFVAVTLTELFIDGVVGVPKIMPDVESTCSPFGKGVLASTP